MENARVVWEGRVPGYWAWPAERQVRVIVGTKDGLATYAVEALETDGLGARRWGLLPVLNHHHDLALATALSESTTR